MIGDDAEGEDQLGVEPVTSALAETLVYSTLAPPFVLAILGKWGSGKSFNFNLILQEFGKIQDTDLSKPHLQRASPFVGHIYPIVFNVWTYSKANLMASLMLTILKGLNKQLQYEKIIGKDLLLEGVNLVELMGKVSQERLKEQLKDEENVKKWMKVGADGGLNVSNVLIKAVTTAQEAGKEDLDKKKNEIRTLEAQLVAGYIEKQESRYAWWQCRDKSLKLRALINLGYRDYIENIKDSSDNENEIYAPLEMKEKLV